MRLLVSIALVLALVCVADMAATSTKTAAQTAYCGDTPGGCARDIQNIEARASYARKDATMVTIWVRTNASYAVNTTTAPPPLVQNVTKVNCTNVIVFNGTDNVTMENCTTHNETVSVPQFKTVNETVFKAIYIPTVDVFPMLEIIDSGLYMYRDTTAHVSVSVYQQGANLDSEYPNQIFSTEKVYTDATMFVETWGIIASMSKGVYQSLTWDDGCENCAGGKFMCIDSTCATNYATIVNSTTLSSSEKVKRTNVKIQFAWVGEDSKSQTLTSKGYLFSNFERYSIFANVQTGESVTSQIIQQNVENVNDANATPFGR